MFVFIIVSLIGVWRVVWVKNNGLYWLLTILYLPLVVEMVLTLRRRGGKDYKWYELQNIQAYIQYVHHGSLLEFDNIFLAGFLQPYFCS